MGGVDYMCHWKYRGPLETVEAQAHTKVRIVKMQVRGQLWRRWGGILSSETSINKLKIM